jgi:hypothetical protein
LYQELFTLQVKIMSKRIVKAPMAQMSLTIEWLRGRGGRFVWDTDRNEWTNHAWLDHGPA